MKMRSAMTSLCYGMATLLLTIALPAQASEFRQFRPITVPQARPAPPSAAGIAAGVARSSINVAGHAAVQPVPKKLARLAVGKLLAAWNSNRIDSVLGKEFFDKSRLSDAMNTKVPRDARLSLLAIQGVRTLDQKTADSPSGKLLVSTVSITANTQLTYNDPLNGYQRREGVNEYILRIKQLAR